jgi:hypothetical protein
MTGFWIGEMVGDVLVDAPPLLQRRCTWSWLARLREDPKAPRGMRSTLAKMDAPGWHIVVPCQWGRGTVVEGYAAYFCPDPGPAVMLQHPYHGVILERTLDAMAVILYENSAQAMEESLTGIKPEKLLAEGYLHALKAQLLLYESMGIEGPRRALLDERINDVRNSWPDKYLEWWLAQ